jgi:Pycsar effector protein
MKPQPLSSAAKDQLNLVLSFFSRADAKASVVLAIDTAMAGYLAGRTPPLQTMPSWELPIPILTFALIGASIYKLYKGAFPNLTGGNLSLVYFREIAKRTEANFIEEFLAQDETAYAKDLLGQAWRNSQILTEKFNHLKWAFILMALAVVPWAASLAILATRTAP